MRGLVSRKFAEEIVNLSRLNIFGKPCNKERAELVLRGLGVDRGSIGDELGLILLVVVKWLSHHSRRRWMSRPRRWRRGWRLVVWVVNWRIIVSCQIVHGISLQICPRGSSELVLLKVKDFSF